MGDSQRSNRRIRFSSEQWVTDPISSNIHILTFNLTTPIRPEPSAKDDGRLEPFTYHHRMLDFGIVHDC